MCEATAYMMDGETETLVMESVDTVFPEGSETLRITNIFGEQKILSARIFALSLVDHRILLKPVP